MKKRIILIAVAIILAIGSFFATDMIVQAKLQEVPVVVAKQAIKVNQAFSKDNVEVVKMSNGSLHPLAVKELKQVLGKKSSIDLIKGQVILAPQAQTSLNTEHLFNELKPEERVVAIHTNLVHSVGGTIKPGDWVDVVAVVENSVQEVRSQTILKRVRVMDVRSDDALPTSNVNQNERIINTGAEGIPGAVLLALKADQVEKIAAFDYIGKIVLSIHPEEATVVETSGYTLAGFNSRGGQ